MAPTTLGSQGITSNVIVSVATAAISRSKKNSTAPSPTPGNPGIGEFSICVPLP